jgi:hypothetical protein
VRALFVALAVLLVSGGRTGDAPTLARCTGAKPAEGRTRTLDRSFGKPSRGAAYADPSFGGCVVRATDHAADGLPGFARHDYSRRQAFNADSSLFLVTAHDGNWYLYDATTFKKVKQARYLSGDAEPQWDARDPNILYFGAKNGGLEVKALDVRTDETRVAIDLRGRLPWPTAARAWTKSEGSPSRDGRFWPFQVETADFEILGFAVWDRAKDRLVGTLSTKSRPDHVSMSPSGRWFVSSGDDTVAWKPDFSASHLVRKGGEHSDLAIGSDGHDYYVSVDFDDNDGDVFMLDLDTGRRTDLFATYLDHGATSVHVSGKAFDRPGWVLVSTFYQRGPREWFSEAVFALEMREHPRVYRLAAHHSAAADVYPAEPQATVNRGFTRALFNSNWGAAGSNDVDAYLIRLPPEAFP